MTDDEDLIDIASKIARSEHVVFLTGAGLSVASGIAPYRKSKDAVWSRFITEWGTMERFYEDPLSWWREFWIKAHGVSLEGKLPNPGHTAITALAQQKPGSVVVTQNIDGLHRLAGVAEDQLVEIHGRHDRFSCSSQKTPPCRRVSEPVSAVDLAILDDGNIPRCDLCGAPLRPLVLLFDEMYDSHPAYNMRKAKHAFNDAEIVLFVGTSFSVGITDYAIRAAQYARATLVNVNVEKADPGVFENLLGPAEEVLPELVRHVAAAART